MKIISKNYWQERHKKFCWTNFNKIRRFLLNQDEYGTNRAIEKQTKISVVICNRRYFKGGPIYRSVSSRKLVRKITVSRVNFVTGFSLQWIMIFTVVECRS